MPPKKNPSDDNIVVKKNSSDDLIESLLEPRVMEALGKALGTTISAMVSKSVEERLETLLGRISNLEQRVHSEADERLKLAAENTLLQTRVAELEAYTRSENLIFHGLELTSMSEAISQPGDSNDQPHSSGSPSNSTLSETNRATEDNVLKFGSSPLGVSLPREDISVAHRLGKRPGDPKPAPVIVRFTTRRVRNAVFGARKSLKAKGVRVFINEHLTSSRAKVFGEARKLVKEKRLEGAWTNNGAVFIRLSGLPNSRPKKVELINDLPHG